MEIVYIATLSIGLGIVIGIVICWIFIKRGKTGPTGKEGAWGAQGLMGVPGKDGICECTTITKTKRKG